jgi:hypothetical protein
VTTAPASGSTALAAHVRLTRAAADLIEQAGIDGLAVYPQPDVITVQVPQDLGGIPARVAAITRLAALAGCQPEPETLPGATQGWLHARGEFAGHPVHVFAPIRKEQEAP